MGGVRLGGQAVLIFCSPPFGDTEGTDGDGDANVYRACTGDTAGAATLYSDFNDGALTSEGVTNPVLSPNKTMILFEMKDATSGFTEIWVTDNVPGGTATQLEFDNTQFLKYPSWSSDSNTFVYMKGAGGGLTGGSILKSSVSAPGTIATLKTASGGFSPVRPQFNFDGTRIAYNWDQDVGGTGHLRVMDADGTNDASIDSAVKYRFQGPQFSWAHSMNVIAYDDGDNTPGVAATYVINDDGTGKVQINTNGDAAGLVGRVSDRAWPQGDGYVVFSCDLALGVGNNPIRAELDGSDTTDLAPTHGAWAQDYFRQVIVANNRIWFIESAVVLGSVAIDGSDYQNYLTIDGAAMTAFGSGSGWYYT